MNLKRDDVELELINEILKNVLRLTNNKNNELECYLNEVEKSLNERGFSEDNINFIWVQIEKLLKQINMKHYDKSASEAIKLIKRRIGN